MFSRVALSASRSSVMMQKRTLMSHFDLFQIGLCCLTPLALSSLSLIAQTEFEDYQKLRAKVDAAKNGTIEDKALAIHSAIKSKTWGHRTAVRELLESVPDSQKFDLSCGKSWPIRKALISSILCDKTLARQILTKSLTPCSCIILSERGIKLNCPSNKESKFM
jgi:hypothetical protein